MSAAIEAEAGRRADTSGWQRAGGVLRWAVLAAVLVATLAFVVPPALSSFLLLEKNYNEGWNAYHAARAASGAVLYDDDLRRIVNYPFLSFYLASALSPLFGGMLFAGRALSMIGLLGMGGAGFYLARRFGAGARGALFSGLACVGFAALAAPGWIVADDPQALAEALMMAGLACYVSGRDDPKRLAIAAALLMLGGFTKQTLVAIPLAVTIDVVARGKRQALLWLLFCLAAAAALLAATYLVAGGDFIARLLGPRVLSWDGMIYHPRKFLIMFKLPLVVVAIWLAGFAPREWRLLLRLYALFSLLSANFFAAGDGVSYNVMFDSAACLGLLGGVVLDGSGTSGSKSAARRVALLAIPLLLAWPMLVRGAEAGRSLAGLDSGLAAARSEAQLFRADADFVAAQPGDAVCENLLLCFAAGKALVLDPFNARQLMLAGQLDENSLVGEIHAWRYGAIELRDVIYKAADAPGRINPALHFPARFTDPVLEAIAQSYHVARQSAGRVIYLPNNR